MVTESPLPNPFATRFVRPDRGEYRPPAFDRETGTGGRSPENGERRADHERLERIEAKTLLTLDRCGMAAIVGPHGTGKSTLLHSLRNRLRDHYSSLAWFRLHQQCRGLPAACEVFARPAARSCLPRCIVIDGFEQLSLVQRWRLIARYRRRRFPCSKSDPTADACLVTMHRDHIGVETVYRTAWCGRQVRQLTRAKLQSLPEPLRRRMLVCAERRAEQVERLPHARRSVRDYWFCLYDDFENLRRAGGDAV